MKFKIVCLSNDSRNYLMFCTVSKSLLLQKVVSLQVKTIIYIYIYIYIYKAGGFTIQFEKYNITLSFFNLYLVLVLSIIRVQHLNRTTKNRSGRPKLSIN